MNEIISVNENAVERNLNEREILNKFEDILEGRDFEDLGQVEDEQGLYSWDIKTTAEGTGDRVDIIYARSKVFEDGIVRPARIHQTLYDGDVPCGAGAQYDFENGEWVVKS